MVQVNYCDVCEKEISAQVFEVKFYIDDRDYLAYELCRPHVDEVEGFLRSLKKIEKKKRKLARQGGIK